MKDNFEDNLFECEKGQLRENSFLELLKMNIFEVKLQTKKGSLI